MARALFLVCIRSDEDYARCVHCGLCLSASGLPFMEPGSGFAARPHSSDDSGGASQRCGHALFRRAPRQMSGRPRAKPPVPREWNTESWSNLHARESGGITGRPLSSRLAHDFVYRRLLPHAHRIAAAARLLRFYQRSGWQSIARSTGILKLLGLAERERLLPRVRTSRTETSPWTKVMI